MIILARVSSVVPISPRLLRTVGCIGATLRAVSPAAEDDGLAPVALTTFVDLALSPIVSEAGVRFAGRHYASRQSWSLVVTAEATTGSGRPAAAVLDAVADVAAEFPQPEG